MLKLSRRNWNNVLIFVVLLLMFVLYGIPQRLQQLTPAPSRLIPADAELLMVGFAEQRLIKAGTQWQLQPGKRNPQFAAQLALAWQHSLLTPVDTVPDKSRIPLAQASVQLVGQSAPFIWLLYRDNEQYLLQLAGEAVFYQLSAEQAALLFML
jgi:hypothetical protein